MTAVGDRVRIVSDRAPIGRLSESLRGATGEVQWSAPMTDGRVWLSCVLDEQFRRPGRPYVSLWADEVELVEAA